VSANLKRSLLISGVFTAGLIVGLVIGCGY
jgi:hypothetical protein